MLTVCWNCLYLWKCGCTLRANKHFKPSQTAWKNLFTKESESGRFLKKNPKKTRERQTNLKHFCHSCHSPSPWNKQTDLINITNKMKELCTALKMERRIFPPWQGGAWATAWTLTSVISPGHGALYDFCRWRRDVRWPAPYQMGINRLYCAF